MYEEDFKDLGELSGRWSKSGWFRARNGGEAWSPRLILYRFVAAREERYGQKGCPPRGDANDRMEEEIEWFLPRSRILSSCRADSKVGVKHIYHASNNV